MGRDRDIDLLVVADVGTLIRTKQTVRPSDGARTEPVEPFEPFLN